MLTSDELEQLSKSRSRFIISMLGRWKEAREDIQFWMKELSAENLSESDIKYFNYMKGASAGKFIAYTVAMKEYTKR